MFGAAIASAEGFIQCLERPQLQRRDLYNVWSGHSFSARIYTMFGAAIASAEGFIRCNLFTRDYYQICLLVIKLQKIAHGFYREMFSKKR